MCSLGLFCGRLSQSPSRPGQSDSRRPSRAVIVQRRICHSDQATRLVAVLEGHHDRSRAHHHRRSRDHPCRHSRPRDDPHRSPLGPASQGWPDLFAGLGHWNDGVDDRGADRNLRAAHHVPFGSARPQGRRRALPVLPRHPGQQYVTPCRLLRSVTYCCDGY